MNGICRIAPSQGRNRSLLDIRLLARSPLPLVVDLLVVLADVAVKLDVRGRCGSYYVALRRCLCKKLRS